MKLGKIIKLLVILFVFILSFILALIYVNDGELVIGIGILLIGGVIITFIARSMINYRKSGKKR